MESLHQEAESERTHSHTAESLNVPYSFGLEANQMQCFVTIEKVSYQKLM